MNKHILRSWIEVDFDRLESNVANIKALLPDRVRYIAVVKADAYGHCMPQALVRFLKGGADLFAVANLYEASRVREIISDRQILILSPILKEERSLVFDYNATPSISTIDEAKDFNNLAKLKGKILGVHIKIDTSMGRSGVWYSYAKDLFDAVLDLENLKINGIFSHLSSADTDIDYTKNQIEIFKQAISGYITSDMLVHIHNSASLSYVPIDKPFNAVRMGLIQYGINPYNDGSGFENLDLKPVLSFKSRILAIGKRNDKIIAVVSSGYADGVPSGFTKDARVLVNATRCKILGQVGLDEMYIDVTNSNAKIGDEVTFIGEQQGSNIGLSDYSKWTHRIPWETMVAIPIRVDRILK